MKWLSTTSSYPISMDQLLETSVKKKASDLHMVVGRPPCIRVNGDIIPMDFPIMIAHDIQKVLCEIITQEQIDELKNKYELDFSYAIPGCSRFRGNIIIQRGTLAAVFRVVPFELPNLDKLGLPEDIKKICSLTRGLILATGPTGSGKSTTLAAIIDRINTTRKANIITVEDPIEFLHTHNQSIVRQREVGIDTHSFSSALRQALRHDPDVIMIGEMRDPESISIALTAAETGHLVISTLHTQTAPLSISRIVDSFPNESKGQVRQQLAGSLKAIISQQLVPTIAGGRALALEYMVDTPAICTMIRDGREHQLYGAIQTGKAQGMHTMDQSLARLVMSGKVALDDALVKCVDAKELQRLIQGAF